MKNQCIGDNCLKRRLGQFADLGGGGLCEEEKEND